MKKLLTLVAALSFVGVTSAGTFDLGPLTVGTPTPFAELNGPGLFIDALKFTVSTKSVFGASVSSFEAFPDFKTVLFGMGLVSNPDGILFNADDKLVTTGLTLGLNPILPGNYYLEVAGAATGKNGGVYQGAALLVAVPEPETYALMLAGLGTIGFMARRRKE